MVHKFNVNHFFYKKFGEISIFDYICKKNKKMETLKEKCERLRSATDYKLNKNTYTMVMIDGKNFSKLIKNHYKKPFDDIFINIMNEVAIYVCKNIQNCKFAYVQSDEITFVLTDFEAKEIGAYYDYRLCKILSLIPSFATAKFNQMAILNLLETQDDIVTARKMVEDIRLAHFDCKAWNVDSFNDAYAHLLWRQIDCVRNSKQMAAQTYLPYKEIVNKNSDEQIKMLLEKTNIDWHNYTDDKKYGRFIYREEIEIPLSNDSENSCIRHKWMTHNAFPLFKKDSKEKLNNMNIIPVRNEY